MKKYHVYFIDSMREVIMSEAQAIRHFGRDEWVEYKNNYLPHVVVAECD